MSGQKDWRAAMGRMGRMGVCHGEDGGVIWGGWGVIWEGWGCDMGRMGCDMGGWGVTWEGWECDMWSVGRMVCDM